MGKIVTSICMLLIGTYLARAEDSGAIIAAMPTAVAECRYLKQLNNDLMAAIATVERNTIALQEGKVSLTESEAMSAAMVQKANNLNTALNVLRAKRGVEEPCLEREPASIAEENTLTLFPFESSTADQRKALLEDWHQGRITIEEYRRRRDVIISPGKTEPPSRLQPAGVYQQSVPPVIESTVPSVTSASVSYQAPRLDPKAALLDDWKNGRITLEEYRRRRDALEWEE